MKYARAAALYAKKRGQYRSIGHYKYMDKEGDNYILYNGKPSSAHSSKFLTVYPDDTVELHWYNNGQGMANDLYRYTYYQLKRRSGSTLSHNYFVVGVGVDTPIFDGLKIRGREVLNPMPLMKRTIDTTVAKKVRDKLAHWKKVFDVVYMMRRPEIEAGTHWEKRLPSNFAWPGFNDEVDANMAFALLRDADGRTESSHYVASSTEVDERIGWNNVLIRTPRYLKVPKPTHYKNLLNNATNKLRDRWYEEVGAYRWTETQAA